VGAVVGAVVGRGKDRCDPLLHAVTATANRRTESLRIIGSTMVPRFWFQAADYGCMSLDCGVGEPPIGSSVRVHECDAQPLLAGASVPYRHDGDAIRGLVVARYGAVSGWVRSSAACAGTEPVIEATGDRTMPVAQSVSGLPLTQFFERV
jgi:hypothetical protein